MDHVELPGTCRQRWCCPAELTGISLDSPASDHGAGANPSPPVINSAPRLLELSSRWTMRACPPIIPDSPKEARAGVALRSGGGCGRLESNRRRRPVLECHRLLECHLDGPCASGPLKGLSAGAAERADRGRGRSGSRSEGRSRAKDVSSAVRIHEGKSDSTGFVIIASPCLRRNSILIIKRGSPYRDEADRDGPAARSQRR